MTGVLLDTHVIHWWSSEPERLSESARQALEAADELLLAAISWYELAWMARRGRIILNVPIRSWLEELTAQVRTVSFNAAIADTAVTLPDSFPRNPADRLIYATAIEHGTKLVTKDQAIREHDKPRSLVVW
jgi:PIN domain nuclease of toxin-antitoxin system